MCLARGSRVLELISWREAPNFPALCDLNNMPTHVSRGKRGTYVLMTAAHNEEQNIAKTLQSVISQTVLPERWVIVSDNSNDRTDEIIERYAQQHSFIRFLRVQRLAGRSFRSKVLALHQGAPLLEGAAYDYIGNVDADLSLPANYFESLISKFQEDSDLGICGGFVYEENHGRFESRKINETRNVPHAAQLVRRQCYEQIGGYAVLDFGGEDWYAQTQARMKGWEVESFPELHIFHHRHTGEGSQKFANCVRLGHLDYSFGSDPFFEVLKCIKRIGERPYLFAAGLRLGAFFWDTIRKKPRPVTKDFIAFLRNEQKLRMGFTTPSDKPHRNRQNSKMAMNKDELDRCEHEVTTL